MRPFIDKFQQQFGHTWMKGALKRQSRFRVAAIATTVQEVLNAVRSERVDVALISVTLADHPSSGFGVMRRMRECSPGLKSVVLLDNSDRNLIVDAFRVGASGVFCSSESSFEMLCRCLDQVHAGQIWAKRSELVHVMEEFSQVVPIKAVKPDGLRLLTKREEDVVRLLDFPALFVPVSQGNLHSICAAGSIKDEFDSRGYAQLIENVKQIILDRMLA